MKRVAVLGGGPAGSVAAARLSAAGLDTVLLDEKLAWEKPCGGGVTWKAYSRYPFLIDNDVPKRRIDTARLSAPDGGSASMRLVHPVLIYSRRDLNQMLLDRATRAGAQVEQERVTGLERQDGRWRVRTRRGSLEADYVIVATGARNTLRNVGTEWTGSDAMGAMGYFVPVERQEIDIQFWPGFEGYLWVFPRQGHLSVGICGKGMPASKLRAMLENYMKEHGIPIEGSTFYGHVIPSLERPAWQHNRVCGEGWIAAGDAAGFVDPVTGEGIYYAVRSGDLAAQAILDEAHAPDHKHSLYQTLLQRDFVADLTLAAGIARRFFVERILHSSVPARMIELMRSSPRMCDIVQDLFAGKQDYLSLKRRLLGNMNGAIREALVASLFSRRQARESTP